MTGREKLCQLAEDIAGILEQERRLKNLVARTISPELGEWFIAAIKAFQGGEAIGKALGLTKGRGRPRPPAAGKNYDRAKEILNIFWRCGSGKHPSWYELGREFDADPRDLRADVERYTPDIVAEFYADIAKKINKRSSDKEPRRPLGMK